MVGGTGWGDPCAEPMARSSYLAVAQPVLKPDQRCHVALRYLGILTLDRSGEPTGGLQVTSDRVWCRLEPDLL